MKKSLGATIALLLCSMSPAAHAGQPAACGGTVGDYAGTFAGDDGFASVKAEIAADGSVTTTYAFGPESISGGGSAVVDTDGEASEITWDVAGELVLSGSDQACSSGSKVDSMSVTDPDDDTVRVSRTP
jgi:hypothetical protein